ncbi:helix-turn-helix domain-containing protein [Nocardia sp. NPDC127579]|uniref:GbsR/MarR family transcriptional regulator n=1 Tax=Nocardia sp. NPDC127579 TaxID=3345402 RepID=UPI00363F420B
MPGGRLTAEDRQQIAAGLADGLGYAEIGRRLDRPASTIMREVTRNGGLEGYRADRAQRATGQRARRAKPAAPPELPAPDLGPGRDPEAVRALTESVTELLVRQGMPRMESRVLACLQIADSGALTAAELVQRLRISPASVSHAIGFLEQQRMLSRERVPGARRERYVLDEGIWLRNLVSSVRTQQELAAESQRAAEILGPDTPAGTRFAAWAELLHLVNEALRGATEEWQRRLEARNESP